MRGLSRHAVARYRRGPGCVSHGGRTASAAEEKRMKACPAPGGAKPPAEPFLPAFAKSGGRGRPPRGNALASSVARHGVARFRSPWERGRPGRRGKQDENMSPAEARKAQRHSLPVPRLQPGNAGHHARMIRKIAPRRGALQKRRRMRSSWREDGSLFEAASAKNGSRPPVVWACSHRNRYRYSGSLSVDRNANDIADNPG